MEDKKVIKLPTGKYDEITVAVVGHVDAGKSTTVGVLTHPDFKWNGAIESSKIALDDGDGKARSRILRHQHEAESGQTSSISYNYMTMEHETNSRMINFVDLAGHKDYLKTTITGIVSSFPDYALVCVGSSIEENTKEHIKILLNMRIPFLVIFNKVDQVPLQIMKHNIQEIKRYFKRFDDKLKMMKINSTEAMVILKGTGIIPFIKMSNKTGEGIDLLCQIIHRAPKRNMFVENVFIVDHIYTVPGFGTVVSGVCGMDIKKNLDLFLGPFQDGSYQKVRVRTIHNDYRHFVDELHPNVRGCLCVKLTNIQKKMLRTGMVLTNPDNLEEVKNNTKRKFSAKIMIFHHSTTIKPGYTAFVNCHSIKETVVITKIHKKDCLRSSDISTVDMEFHKNDNFIQPNFKFLFREGKTTGIGKIIG